MTSAENPSFLFFLLCDEFCQLLENIDLNNYQSKINIDPENADTSHPRHKVIEFLNVSEISLLSSFELP